MKSIEICVIVWRAVLGWLCALWYAAPAGVCHRANIVQFGLAHVRLYDTHNDVPCAA